MILIAYDGSADSQAAVERARGRRGSYDGSADSQAAVERAGGRRGSGP
ncbi:MAG TPA: hypothetical protein VMF09_06675 [Solirubrobacteraceae bacterium]|nr:hypothetical protein [Solirubrobacteraceae bacterium]